MGQKYSKVKVSSESIYNTKRGIPLNDSPKEISLSWKKIKIAVYSLKNYRNKKHLDENNDLIKTSIYACIINEIHARKTFIHLIFSFLYGFKPIWDLLISFSLFFELVFSPYQDSHDNIGNDAYWFILSETVTNFIFFIDAFYDIRFDLEKMPIAKEAFENPYEISIGKKIKFIIQIISCIPYQFLDFRLRYLKILRIVNLHRMIITFQEFMEFIFIRSARYQNIILAMIKLLSIITITNTLRRTLL